MHFPHRKNMHRFSQLATGQIRPGAHTAHTPQETHTACGARNMRLSSEEEKESHARFCGQKLI